jgi:hypothetical protein
LPGLWPGNSGRYGNSITSYNPFVPFILPWLLDPGFFPPGWGPYGPSVSGSGPVSAGPSPGFVGGLVYPVPKYDYYCDPASAPSRLSGTWKSQQRTDESGDKLQGDLNIDVVSDQQIVIMRDFPLALVEGSMSPFEYTRTEGEAPISFKAIFYRGYTGAFSGTADNKLCCRNHMCFWSGTFEVEGKYEIRDNLDQLADKGTFTLKGPASSPGSLPEPDEAIKILKKPFKEGREILSLTTGPDGHIYGGIKVNSLDAGHMFIRDSATGRITDLGNPGYECNAMTTGTDGLIYIGGGTRNATQNECTAVGHANFAVYDPGKSWNPGNGANANPRDLGQAVSFSGNVVGYPIVVHDLVTAPDGKIYGCTGYRDGIESEYYAHLFVYDPQTGKIKDLGQPIPNHSSIIRLAIMPDGTLYGITLPPRTGPNLPHGELFSYDPVSDKFTLFDMPSTMEGAIALAAGKDGLLYIAGGTDDRDIFAYDPVSKTFESVS